MNCIKCKEKIHTARLKVLPKTKVCVNCSSVMRYGCIPITNHKTGNEIQIMSSEEAAYILKKTRRRGYGTMLK